MRNEAEAFILQPDWCKGVHRKVRFEVVWNKFVWGLKWAPVPLELPSDPLYLEHMEQKREFFLQIKKWVLFYKRDGELYLKPNIQLIARWKVEWDRGAHV
jgi:hypothetical protein